MPDSESAKRQESIYAGVRFFTGRTFKVWILPLLGAAATFCIGWYSGVKSQIAAVDAKVEKSATDQEKGFRAVNQRLDELLSMDDERPGRVIKLERGQRVVLKAIVRSWAAANGGESEKVRKVKADAANDLDSAYQTRLDQGVPPLVAYDEVVRTVHIR